jgi:hypothetical protein
MAQSLKSLSCWQKDKNKCFDLWQDLETIHCSQAPRQLMLHRVPGKRTLGKKLTLHFHQLSDVTREAMYMLPDVTTRKRNHCCRGRAISIIYSE